MPKPIGSPTQPGLATSRPSSPAVWDSPHAASLIEAAALMASGDALKATFLLRDLIRLLEDKGAGPAEADPVYRMYAEAMRQTAAALAFPGGGQLPNVRHRMRADFLREARNAYIVLKDFPNVVRTMRAIADVFMARGAFLGAAQILEEALTLAHQQSLLEFPEMVPFFSQLAKASASAFEKQFERHSDLGPRAAAYLALAGDVAAADAYLDQVADIYFRLSTTFHRNGRYDDAFNVLLQAVVLKTLLGQDDALPQNADHVVQYAILNGDRDSLAVYDRAMRLARDGATPVATAMVLERARALAAEMGAFEALQLYHGTVDNGMHYMARLSIAMFNGDDPDMEKVMNGLWASMDAIFRYGMAWMRTLELLRGAHDSPFIRLLGHSGLTRMAAVGKIYGASISAAQAGYPSSVQYVRPDPELARLLAGFSYGDASTDMREIEVFLAARLGCTPAEVAAALTPYAPDATVARLKGLTGELMFAQLRHAALVHHYTIQREWWREMRGRNGR